MKPFKNTSLYSRLALLTSVTLVVGYFVVYAAWTSIPDVTGWQTLTATLINNILGNLTDLNARVSNFGFSAGNVGIGTASPGAPLEINRNDTDSWIMFHDPGNYNISTGLDTSNGAYVIGAAGDLNNPLVTVKYDGKVWIWTTTPGDTLTVNGGVTANTFTSPVTWSNITPASWWSTANITCRKIWSFLQIRKHANSATGDVTPAWSTNIWTFPVECRPSVGVYIPSTCWSNWYVVSGCLTFVDVDGKVYIYTSTPMYYISFAGTFPAN